MIPCDKGIRKKKQAINKALSVSISSRQLPLKGELFHLQIKNLVLQGEVSPKVTERAWLMMNGLRIN